MSTYLSVELRSLLIEVDDHHYAYCHTTMANSSQKMTSDHIWPTVKGGLTEFSNLYFACRSCNEAKGETTEVLDPLTFVMTSLFHPRRQRWHDHFAWDSTGTRILGLTATGRVTIIALDMNNEMIVFVRSRWVSVGWHPPKY